MTEPSQEPGRPGCFLGCRRCPAAFGMELSGGGLSGGRMVAAAFLGFLLPILLAAAGAVFVPMAWKHRHGGAIGALAGLAVGAAGAAVLVKRVVCKGTQRE